MQSQERQNDLCFQGKPFNITVIQVYAPTTNFEEGEVEHFYDGLQDFLKLSPCKRKKKKKKNFFSVNCSDLKQECIFSQLWKPEI